MLASLIKTTLLKEQFVSFDLLDKFAGTNLTLKKNDLNATLMSHNKGETAVHGHHCSGDMAVRMREVLARPWVGVCVPKFVSILCI